MRKQIKRLATLALLFALAVGILPSAVPSAYATDGVYSAITSFVSPYVGTNYEYYYKVGGTTKAAGCHAFVNSVWKNVFGCDVYSGKDSRTEKTSDFSNFASFMQSNARVGDILRFDYPHSMLIIGVSKTGITVYESMGHSPSYNTVCKSTYTYEKLISRYAGCSYFLYQVDPAIYQSVQKNGSSSSTTAQTPAATTKPSAAATAPSVTAAPSTATTPSASAPDPEESIQDLNMVEAGADPDLQICTVATTFTSTEPGKTIPSLNQTVMLSANNTMSLSTGLSNVEVVGVLINGKAIPDSSYSTIYTDTCGVQITLDQTPADKFSAEILVASQNTNRLCHFIQDNSKAVSFSDVSPSSWSRSSIISAVQYGLMSGTANGTFQPTATLTEGEALALAARLYSIYYNGSAASLAATTPWYQAYVDYCTKTHITDKLSSICPTAPITRQRFAILLSSVFPESEYPALYDYTFTDTANSDVLMLANAGILSGYANGSFGANDQVTREQAATILSRMVDRSKR